MLLWWALCVVAMGADLAEELTALDGAARVAKLTELQAGTTSVDDIAEFGAALLVLKQLDAHGRTDPSVVKAFLRAALSPDPAVRQAAVDAAAANGDPPAAVPSPEPVAAAPVPAVRAVDPGALNDYAARNLRVGSLTLIRTGAYTIGGTGGAVGTTIPTVSSKATWTVYQGAEPVAPRTFSELVGDEATRERIRKTRAWSIPTTVGFATVGLAIMGGSIVVAGETGDLGTSYAVLGAGAGTALLAAIPAGAWGRTARMAKMYKQPDAQDWCDRYNEKLRDELHLTAEDTLPLDLTR